MHKKNLTIVIGDLLLLNWQITKDRSFEIFFIRVKTITIFALFLNYFTAMFVSVVVFVISVFCLTFARHRIIQSVGKPRGTNLLCKYQKLSWKLVTTFLLAPLDNRILKMVTVNQILATFFFSFWSIWIKVGKITFLKTIMQRRRLVS